MKSFCGLLVALGLIGGYLACGTLPPKCQGDPGLMPCSCMNPQTPDCSLPPQDVKHPDGGSK